jgi:hypothetical protein
MARVLQTGFEYPGTAGVMGGTSGTTTIYSITSSANMDLLGLPISTSSIASTGAGIQKTISGYTGIYPPHKSLSNLGGQAYLLVGGSGSTDINIPLDNALSEGCVAFAYKPYATNSQGLVLSFRSSSGAVLFNFRHTGSAFKLYYGATTAAGSLAGSVSAPSFDNSVWSWVVIDFKAYSTTGYIKIYINSVGGTTTPVIDYTWTAGGTNKVGSVSFGFNASGSEYLIDDLVINSKSISYTGSTGTLSAGNTITGASSGATALVTYNESQDSTYGVARAGRVTVSNITGQFSNGETISNGSGWSATIALAGGEFDGLDFNSTKPGETYIIGLSLSGDRTVEMTGSDGNSTNNYALLNEQLADDTTFVQALGVETALDLYELENLTQDISVVSAISLNSRLKKAGEINYAIPAIDLAGQTTYPAPPMDISTTLSYKKKHSVIDVNKNNNEPFSKQNINDLAIGIRFK